MSNYHKIIVTREQSVWIGFELAPGATAADITPEMMEENLAATAKIYEWRTGKPVFGQPFPATEDEMDGEYYQVVHSTTAATTIAARAQQTGLNARTLTRWRKEGVDIFNNHELRQRIAKCRNWIPGLKEPFKLRLGGYED